MAWTYDQEHDLKMQEEGLSLLCIILEDITAIEMQRRAEHYPAKRYVHRHSDTFGVRVWEVWG